MSHFTAADQIPVVFAMNGATDIGLGIEDWIKENWISDFELSDKSEFRRHDREGYTRSKVNVRGRKVYIIQSFASDPDECVDEKIWSVILFASSLKTASASEVILVASMLPYMRQDQKDQPRAPIDTAYIARQFWAAGIDRIIAMDVHNQAAMQNSCAALGVNFDHLEARCPLAEAIGFDLPESVKGDRRVVVLTPDTGATKRTKRFQETLRWVLQERFQRNINIGFAHGDKVRLNDTNTEITTIIEDPSFPIVNSLVVSPDDILATGSTYKGIEEAVRSRGGEFFAACVTHLIGTGRVEDNLEKVPRIYATRTVDPWRIGRTSVIDKVQFVDVSSIFAKALKETHLNGSINSLLTSLDEGSGSTGDFGGSTPFGTLR